MAGKITHQGETYNGYPRGAGKAKIPPVLGSIYREIFENTYNMKGLIKIH